MMLTSCNNIKAFVVSSDNVPQNSIHQFQTIDNQFSMKYDWWSDFGVPIITIKNISSHDISMDWSKSYFLINQDTLKCYLKQSELRRFTGSILPPMAVANQTIKSSEEMEFEGFPFVTRKKYPSKGEYFIYPKVMSPARQTVNLVYFIDEMPFEIVHEFYISSIYRTSFKKLKKSSIEGNPPYDRFYRSSDIQRNSDLLEIGKFTIEVMNWGS